MEFDSKLVKPESVKTACIIAPVFESGKLAASTSLLNQTSNNYISKILKKGDISGKVGQSLLLHQVPGISAERILLVGCGKESELNAKTYRKICVSTLNSLKNANFREAICFIHELMIEDEDMVWKVAQAAQIFSSKDDRRDSQKSIKDETGKLNKITFASTAKEETKIIKQGIARGIAIAQGVSMAKTLGDLPGNVCTPTYLANQAKELAKTSTKLKTTILDEKKMESLRMGALLSVSKGSREPAKLIVMEYNGGKTTQKPIVLVGKGLTFDAGGISIKPAAAMDEMKYDMCGGASVFGVMKAVCELKLPLNVVAVVPASENLPDGAANKPGDIVTSMSGQTIEVLNTDAEGRLILCDALTYSERFNPDVVIDIATLTGACIIALGKHASGLYSNYTALGQALLSAGEESGDRCWEMPLWDEYHEQIKSNFADMGNVGGRDAGSVTAACFLSKYTKKFHWAHLDIAGTAWNSGADKGATGRPVPLLVQYLLNRCND